MLSITVLTSIRKGAYLKACASMDINVLFSCPKPPRFLSDGVSLILWPQLQASYKRTRVSTSRLGKRPGTSIIV